MITQRPHKIICSFLLLTCILWVTSNTNADILNRPTSYNSTLMEMRYRKWMVENKKKYKDIKEWEQHFGIYQSNVQFIDYINSQNLSYKLVDNRFADMTNEEFKSVFMGRLTGIGPSDNHALDNTTYHALPKVVDWRKKGAVTSVKNQGSCGNFSALLQHKSAYTFFLSDPLGLEDPFHLNFAPMLLQHFTLAFDLLN